MFVSYILSHAGYPFKMAYVPSIKQWAVDNGRWFTDRRKAKPGDLVIYWFTTRPDHIGFFARLLPDGRIAAIEGNTGSNNRDGGSVQERYRNSGIHGFVRMNYVAEAPPQPQWPVLTRTLRYGIAPGNDIVIWKLYMCLLGVAPEFAGQNLEQLRTFGKTTSPRVAYRFKVLWNGIHGFKDGDEGYLPPDYTVGAKTWQAVIWSVATHK
jgi:hypothetical protein